MHIPRRLNRPQERSLFKVLHVFPPNKRPQHYIFYQISICSVCNTISLTKNLMKRDYAQIVWQIQISNNCMSCQANNPLFSEKKARSKRTGPNPGQRCPVSCSALRLQQVSCWPTVSLQRGRRYVWDTAEGSECSLELTGYWFSAEQSSRCLFQGTAYR